MDETAELHQRRGKASAIAAGGALITAFCLVVTFGALRGTPAALLWSVPGVLFFGIATVVSIRLLLLRAPVVWAGPEGVRDLRVAGDVIPWPAVLAMEFTDVPDGVMVALSVDRETVESLDRGPAQRLRWGTDAQGQPMCTVTGDGLRGDPARLARVLRHHHPGWTSVTLEQLRQQLS